MTRGKEKVGERTWGPPIHISGYALPSPQKKLKAKNNYAQENPKAASTATHYYKNIQYAVKPPCCEYSRLNATASKAWNTIIPGRLKITHTVYSDLKTC